VEWRKRRCLPSETDTTAVAKRIAEDLGRHNLEAIKDGGELGLADALGQVRDVQIGVVLVTLGLESRVERLLVEGVKVSKLVGVMITSAVTGLDDFDIREVLVKVTTALLGTSREKDVAKGIHDSHAQAGQDGVEGNYSGKANFISPRIEPSNAGLGLSDGLEFGKAKTASLVLAPFLSLDT
jgi:hypothetical protein